MDGKAGEAQAAFGVLLSGFAARLAVVLEARMTLFEAEKAEAAGIEKDAKTIAALARAATFAITLASAGAVAFTAAS